MDGVVVLLEVLLLVLAALVLLVLAAPVAARADGEVDGDGARGRFDAAWAWGLVRFRGGTGQAPRLSVCGFVVPRPAGRDAAERKGRREAKRKANRARRRARDGKRRRRRVTGALVRGLARLARRVVAACHPRVRIAGRVGLPDPADSAVLFGVLAALARVPGIDVDVEPDWIDGTVDLRGAASVRLRPAGILWAAAAWFVTDPAGRRALWSGGAR